MAKHSALKDSGHPLDFMAELCSALSAQGQIMRDFLPRQRHERGFTLIELLVTIAVMAIIMGLAVPSFMSTMAGARLTAAANELLAAIQHTRSEALRRGMRVTLCKAGHASNQCETDAATSWGHGWMSFTDPAT
ncbi:MAG: GspH/FimT family pseudopilin, partial [Halothiobacillaceae bacterium]